MNEHPKKQYISIQSFNGIASKIAHESPPVDNLQYSDFPVIAKVSNNEIILENGHKLQNLPFELNYRGVFIERQNDEGISQYIGTERFQLHPSDNDKDGDMMICFYNKDTANYEPLQSDDHFIIAKPTGDITREKISEFQDDGKLIKNKNGDFALILEGATEGEIKGFKTGLPLEQSNETISPVSIKTHSFSELFIPKEADANYNPDDNSECTL